VEEDIEETGEVRVQANIFHTRVAHKGKTLNVIIDNGSELNVISIVLKPDPVKWSGHGSDGLTRVNPKKKTYKKKHITSYNATLT